MASKVVNRFKAVVAYDGTNFMGFQIQPNQRTVQGELEKALQTIAKGQFVRLHPAGRTDTGVHAAGMVIHFDFPAKITEVGLFKAMNALIPEDIVLKNLEYTDNGFHARYDAKAKTYTYRVYNETLRNPFIRNYALHHPYSMNREDVESALEVLVGRHDFTSFCSQKTDKINKVRTIYNASVEINEETNEWIFTFTGDGFLYHMIRIMMGTLLEIADGRKKPEMMREILEGKDRKLAGPTISSNGLRLEKVYYDFNF